MELYLGVDIGTTAVKASLYDLSSRKVVLDLERRYHVFPVGEGGFEQRPEEVKEAVFSVLANVAERGFRIEAIVLDSALHTLLLLGEDKTPVTNVIPWLDERSVEQVKKLSRDPIACESLHERTGCTNDSVYPLYKLAWIYENESEVLRQARWAVSIKDYLFYHLTGDLVSDISVASGSGYLDIHKKDWCYDLLLDFAKLEREKLPPLVPPDFSRGLKKTAAHTTGLLEGTPVVIGISDAAASSIGAGASVDDSLTVSVGSSAAIRSIISSPPSDYPVPGLWCYVLDEDLYISGAAVKNGGYVFDWYISVLSKRDHDEALELVQSSLNDFDPNDCALFYPFIFGKRFPWYDPEPNARFLYLKSQTDEGEIARSVLEGIAFNLKRAFNVVRKIPKSLDKIVATGRLTRSRTWMKILTSVFDENLILKAKEQGASLGTVIHYLSERNSAKWSQLSPPIEEMYVPDPLLRKKYKVLYQRWLKGLGNPLYRSPEKLDN